CWLTAFSHYSQGRSLQRKDGLVPVREHIPVMVVHCADRDPMFSLPPFKRLTRSLNRSAHQTSAKSTLERHGGGVELQPMTASKRIGTLTTLGVGFNFPAARINRSTRSSSFLST